MASSPENSTPSTPMREDDMMRSFSNPNYLPNVADALNSNLPEYYDDNHIYDEISGDDKTTQPKSGGSKSRTKYHDISLASMGLGDSNERTDSIVEVAHNGQSDDSSSAEKPSQGFLGYYASLEMTARAQLEGDGEEEPPSEEEENSCLLEKSEEAVVDETGGSEATQTQQPLLAAADKHKKRLTRSSDDKMKDINSPDSNDSGIQADVHHIQAPRSNNSDIQEDVHHIQAPRSNNSGIQEDVHHIQAPGSNDVYAVVNKPRKLPTPALKQPQVEPDSLPEGEGSAAAAGEKSSTESGLVLPNGWQMCQDDDGPYYWHIKSGTIQRELPGPDQRDLMRPHSVASEGSLSSLSSMGDLLSNASSNTSSSESPAVPKKTPASMSNGCRQRTPPLADGESKQIRFAVRSLGWVGIEEEDLTPERSSKAVNRCIVDLSLGKHDINDGVGRWGDGKDLYMDVDNQNLSLIDPTDMTVLNVQSIQSIRVWGVGRDNGRDFAYVARDRMTRKHMCHVFRCDTPARQIANTLRDICKAIMVERSLKASASGGGRASITRPTDLPNLAKTTDPAQMTFEKLYQNTSFPTPMEEPKKLIRCHYLGTANVTRPTGVDILNSASEKVYAQVPPEKWVFVNVAVAPSTITITEYGNSDNVLCECRVRFLSFMGIAMRNVKLCSFILHTANDQFVAHVFHSEPSAGALCKTIEAACKLRYQKCLDAHQRKAGNDSSSTQLPATVGCAPSKGIGASIKSVFTKKR